MYAHIHKSPTPQQHTTVQCTGIIALCYIGSTNIFISKIVACVCVCIYNVLYDVLMKQAVYGSANCGVKELP
jgi:hypothetical protein